MADNENPTSDSAPVGFGGDAVLRNTPTLPQNAASSNQRITSLAPHPSRAGTWLLSIDGGPAFAVRDAKIRSAKRVANIALYQGVLIADMPDQAAWAAMLVAARSGGAA